MSQPASARRAKGRAREEEVVAAARAAIAELGLANVRVADIAKRAGIGSGHVTYYFPSKADLLAKAIRRSEEELHESIAAQVGRITDPWKRLRRLIELAAADGPGDPGWVLWFDLWSEAATDPKLAAEGGRLDAWWRGALADAITYGCDRGEFATDDVEGVTVALSAMISGLSVGVTLREADLTRKRAIEMCMSAARLYLEPTRAT